MFGGTRTGGGRSGCGQRLDRPGLLNLYGFYGDTSRSSADGLREPDDPLRDCEGDLRRLSSIFLRDASGRRPVYGGAAKFQVDPHWRDLVLFYEYFHGDNGAGIGASHQTGWTGLVARLLDLFGRVTAQDALETPKAKLDARLVREQVGGNRGEPCPRLGIPRSSRSTRGSGSRSSRPRWGERRLSTTSPTRSSTAWPRTVRPRLVPRRLADRRGGPERLAVEARVARRVPPCPPGLREADVSGSCFAVREYRVHEDFGGDEALARLRWRLQRRGLRLILDFVPNHMAPDHPWATEHPD